MCIGPPLKLKYVEIPCYIYNILVIMIKRQSLLHFLLQYACKLNCVLEILEIKTFGIGSTIQDVFSEIGSNIACVTSGNGGHMDMQARMYGLAVMLSVATLNICQILMRFGLYDILQQFYAGQSQSLVCLLMNVNGTQISC